jgi:MraZ protein
MAGLPKYFGLASTSIDAKNRITIPAKFRNKLPTQPDGKAVLFVMPGADFRHLDIFDSESGTQRIAELTGDGKLPTDEQRRKQRLLGMMEQVELDRQGRVLLPKGHVAYARLKGDVVVSGCGDHLQVYIANEATEVEAAVSIEDMNPDDVAEIYNNTLSEQD